MPPGTLSQRELAVLDGPLDLMAADWEAKKTPWGRRAVNLVLSDAGAGPDPFVYNPPRGGMMETAGGWVNRNLIGGDYALQTPTTFARSVADSTSLVWCHDGFNAAGPEAMAGALARAIIKAHDAGAELNITAQGSGALVVMMALKRVEGQERGGVKVGANKVMLIGVDWGAGGGISGISGKDLARPGNVLELASVWVPEGEAMQRSRMRVYGETKKGEEFFVRDVWPEFAGSSASIEALSALVKGMTAPGVRLEAVIGRQEAALREAEARRAAEEADLKEAQAREADRRVNEDKRLEAAIKKVQQDPRLLEDLRLSNERASKKDASGGCKSGIWYVYAGGKTYPSAEQCKAAERKVCTPCR